MEKGIFKTLELQENETATLNLLWAWQNQPPVMKWWFTFSTITMMAVYFVLLAKL